MSNLTRPMSCSDKCQLQSVKQEKFHASTHQCAERILGDFQKQDYLIALLSNLNSGNPCIFDIIKKIITNFALCKLFKHTFN